MQPYEFKPGSAQLIQQPSGEWVAHFEAAIYDHQSFSEISNSVDPQNIRVIQFDVAGNEDQPLSYQPGNSAPYTRGTETEVQIVLFRDGRKKGDIATSY